MDRLAHAQISRRALLQGTAVVTAGVAVSLGGGSSASASTRPTTATDPLADRLTLATADLFNQSWTQRFVPGIPVRYVLAPLAAAATLTMSWDQRLFRVRSVIATTISTVRQLLPKSSVLGAVEVQVTPDVLEIAFQVETLNAYPNENLSDPKPATLVLRDGDRNELERWTDPLTGSDCLAWGVEGSVSWICHEGWIVPARVALVSVGPFDAPANLRVDVSYPDVPSAPVLVDPSSPEALNPRAVDAVAAPLPGTFEVVSADGISYLSLTTTAPLPPDTGLDLLFEIDTSDASPRTFEFVPRMIISAPEGGHDMRNTGRLSDFPVTPSGEQLSSYELPPTA
ncbi:hypothetical protein QE374_002684 [Microbacterium sp. SORGH_AS428]|uniref:hypothetical protein n=1 Tax=Microbacterium sp. SORGH_AS_0428 TaxID=3041788 RepID=UPI0028596F22|nr:hypothetical protein [Microbacterium sp. SORGH_AS_0428]MDR6200775.1 hypothetical protein [Microbacterium sp. SORGH_AS_0428]